MIFRQTGLLSQEWKACRDIYQGKYEKTTDKHIIFCQGRRETSIKHNKGGNTFTSLLPTSNITHKRNHAQVFSRYAEHSPCVKCVYICVCESSPAEVQRSSERPNSAVARRLPACPSHPCMSCDPACKATRHSHFLQPPLLPPPKKPKKLPTCVHKKGSLYLSTAKFKHCVRGENKLA